MSQDQLGNGDVEFSYQTPEQEKERRLQAMRERFDAATPRNVDRPSQSSEVVFVFGAIIFVAVFAYFFQGFFEGVTKNRPVIKRQVSQEPAATRESLQAIPANNGRLTLPEVKEIYWQQVYSPAPECKKAKTALKDLECKNLAENARRQFERQWASKLATGWNPRELK